MDQCPKCTMQNYKNLGRYPRRSFLGGSLYDLGYGVPFLRYNTKGTIYEIICKLNFLKINNNFWSLKETLFRNDKTSLILEEYIFKEHI